MTFPKVSYRAHTVAITLRHSSFRAQRSVNYRHQLQFYSRRARLISTAKYAKVHAALRAGERKLKKLIDTRKFYVFHIQYSSTYFDNLIKFTKLPSSLSDYKAMFKKYGCYDLVEDTHIIGFWEVDFRLLTTISDIWDAECDSDTAWENIWELGKSILEKQCISEYIFDTNGNTIFKLKEK